MFDENYNDFNFKKIMYYTWLEPKFEQRQMQNVIIYSFTTKNNSLVNVPFAFYLAM